VLAASRDKKDEVAPVVDDALFKVDLDLIEDGKEISRVKKFYNDTKGSHSDVQHYDVRRVFRLNIHHMAEAFNVHAMKMENVWELWHGTKASNMLSILKVGMIVPPAGAPHVTARMFGDGLYFSDQSTKSIRYATGAWGGSGKTDRKFMFLAKVAMGKYYVPSGQIKRLPAGYDSCFAQANNSGVRNNEMIVFKTYQACPVRLIEFTPYGK
jgi:poly [ADP-ribose] polymerase